MTRNGKIARLPREIREQLNQRLQDGEEGNTLLEWLNALPAVQEVLEESFGGQPVSKQNLSEWRQGGYREWLARQRALEFVRSLESGDAGLQPELSGPLNRRAGSVVGRALRRSRSCAGRR